MDRREVLSILAAEAARGGLTFSTSAAVALRIRQALDDPDCQVDAATRLIQSEPLLSARVVAVANSITFNRSGRSVTDVRAAITLLGFRTVRILATAMVVRQLAAVPDAPALQAFGARLWTHSAYVAALARVLALRVTRQDPETAMFAGMVHEIGGFYLLSRAREFPGLIDGVGGDWFGEDETDFADKRSRRASPEIEIGRAVLKALSVPEPVVAAIEVLWQGYLAFPPATLGDTLLLANQLTPVASPLLKAPDKNHKATAVTIDMIIEQGTLTGILEESAAEVNSLTEALRF